MKKFLFSLLVAVLAIPAFAQSLEKDKSDSKAVAFSSRQGALITRVFYPIGDVKGVNFEVLLMVDELKQEKIACLRLKTYSSVTEDDYIGTLDADEIDACMQSLAYIKHLRCTPNVNISQKMGLEWERFLVQRDGLHLFTQRAIHLVLLSF